MRFSRIIIQIATLLVLLLLSFNASAQWLNFIGSIYDAKNNDPIPYANISVLNQPLGTCSNIYGDFVLNLPDSFSSGKLEISCIGYRSCSLPIDSLMAVDTLLISLIPMEYQLEDIVVVPGKNDAATIIKNVISRIDNNYPHKKYFLEAFFRHRVFNLMDNHKTVRLTEAALSIHQNYYSKENKKVQVNEIRNSKNYQELSTSMGMKLFIKMMGGKQNPVYKTLSAESIVQKNWLKKMAKNNNYSLTLSDVSFYNENLVYILEFKQESFEFLFKKYPSTQTYWRYRYYVNANDYAILKTEGTKINHNPAYKFLVINDSVSFREIIQFRELDGKYYLNYAYLFGGIPDAITKVDSNNFYANEAELLVNEIATRRNDYDRIKSRNKMKKNTTLWDMDYEYQPAFWENYNLLLDHPLNTRYKKDLEFEEPLEEQYKKAKDVKVGN